MSRLIIRAGCAAFLLVLTSVRAEAGPDDDRRLLDAARSRDAGTVIAMLRVANVNATQPDGTTALHWAAHWDDGDTVQALVRARANVNAANDLGVTPLLVACADASAAVVSALLDGGGDANAKMPSGETALMVASRTGRPGAVRALLLHGADANARDSARQQTALMWAVAEGHPDVVRLLLEAGADVQARSAVRQRTGFIAGNRNGTGHSPESILANSRVFDEGGYTALLLAAREDDAESARLLLASGAGVDDTAADGTSALVVAAHSDSPHVVTLLLDAGARPDADGGGYTALHAAVLRGNLQVVTAMLAAGAQPNVRIARATPARRYGNEYAFGEHLIGTTPFYLAAKFGELGIMRALAAAGADVRAQAADGSTAVMIALDTPATRTGGAEGFGTDRRDRYGLITAVTPDQVEGDALAIAQLAIELGGDVHQVDGEGNTALHLAASKGFNRVVELLIDNGADVNARNSKGQTPLGAAEAATAVGAARRRMTGGNQRVSDETASSTVSLLRQRGASK